MLFEIANKLTATRFRHAHYLVLVICLALTGAIWRFTVEIEDRGAQARFNQGAARYLLAIERGSSDSMDSVRTLRMLFRLLPDASTQQFRDFTMPILMRISHLRALVYIREIPHAERPSIEKQLSANGYRHGITDYDAQTDSLIPASSHERYAYIHYAEPIAENVHLPGYNLHSREGLSKILEQARDSGDLVVTPKMRLLEGDHSKSAPEGIIGYLPLYVGPDWLPADTPDRRKRLFGYAAVVFHTDAMFKLILDKVGYQSKDGIDLTIYDGESAAESALIFRRHGEPENAGLSTQGSTATVLKPFTRRISVGGRNWLLEAKTKSDAPYLTRLASRWVLFGGVVVTLLLTALFRFLMRYTVQVERQVEERTAELEATQHDLSEKNTLHEALAQAQSDMGDGIMIIQHRRIVYANDHLCKMLDYSLAELYALPQFITIFEENERTRVFDRHIRRVSGERIEQVYETRLLTKSQRVIEVVLAAVKVEWKGEPAAVVEVRDITEKVNAQQRIVHLAHHDSLTDLPNRALLHDRLQQAIALAKRHQKQVAVLYMDLDGFKQANDAHGHDVGDQLLIGVAERLQQCVRKTDTVARLGGDEFVILLPDIDSGDDAVFVANKVIAALAEPIKLAGGLTLRISASVGVNYCPPGATDAEIMLKQADQAMYEAKRAGKNRYTLFEEMLHSTFHTEHAHAVNP
ncbi:MAG: GGDEF domain-containing protein [Burkholderiales bacterium]|nr:GGDEF domain-containing protein [Burkholderiales bacterium]